MKAYKGFNNDMTCCGFQYAEGGEYETDKAEVCVEGFHACLHPLDCFGYYDPGQSVYHEVDLDGKIDAHGVDDTKVAATKIKIGARLDVAGLVEAAIDVVMSKVKRVATADEDHGFASERGDQSACSATGDQSACSATGSLSACSATGDQSACSATGSLSACSATGDQSACSATGSLSACSATGYQSACSATGYQSAASADNPTAIAVAWGVDSKAKGVKDSHIVLSEWHWDCGECKYALFAAKMVRIDGEKYKPDTWYTLDNGEVVEATGGEA